MSRDFVKSSDVDFSLQLKQMSLKLPVHLTTLGLAANDASDATAASDFFKFVLDQQIAHGDRAKNWTNYKDLLRNPNGTPPPSTLAPVTLVVPVAPTAVAFGIEVWYRLLAKRIKGSRNYTNAIGKDLGIVIENTGGIDTSDVQPRLKLQLAAGQPLIIWKKERMDGIAIYKDVGDGNWTFLKMDTRPNHLDNSPLPAVGTSVTWRYKAIYVYQDAEVGQWSDEAMITVSGTV